MKVLSLGGALLLTASLAVAAGVGARAAAPEPELSLPFTTTRFQPGGEAGLARLLNHEPLERATIAAEVQRQGFFSGEPLGAQDCATCHPEIAAQWAQSAHRFASFNNPYYAAAVEQVARDRPPAQTRFCAGCHDPALLITDEISRLPGLPRATAAAQAGLPCLACHSITAGHGADERRGNGGFTMMLAPVPPPQNRPGPSAHAERLRPAALATPEFCAHCHKVGLPGELTQDGWFRGQNDYDPWQMSLAAGQGAGAVYRDAVTPKRCQDCHMPLETGPSGKPYRSHRFLAANTALPHLRGDADMEARTAAFLRGAVSLDLLVLPAAERGRPPRTEAEVSVAGEVMLDVVLRNRRVGHRFPSGTMDSNEARVVLEVSDGSRVLLRDDRHVLRAQPVNSAAEPLRRRDVQHFRGVVYDTSLAPADSQVTRYRLDLSSLPVAKDAVLTVKASLRYRKFSPDYASFACAPLPAGPARDRCLAPPVVEMAAATRTLRLGRAPAPSLAAPGADSAQRSGASFIDSAQRSAAPFIDSAQRSAAPFIDAAPLWERLLDHGLGLSDGVVDQAAEALPSLERAAALAPDRAEPQLGLARLHLAQGRTEEVLRACQRAEALRPRHPAALWLAAQALYRTYRFAEARPYLERLAAQLPRDRGALGMLARVRGLTGDAPGALAAADQLLGIDSESEEGHYQRGLSLRELRRPEEAARAEDRYLKFRRRVEQEQALRDRFRRNYPDLADEDAPAHTHDLRGPS